MELSLLVVKTAGLKPDLVELPWKRGLIYMEHGKIQYMTNLAKTEERSKYMRWIGPFRRSSMVLIVKKGNEDLPIRSLDDIITVSRDRDKHFGLQVGIYYSEGFQRRIKSDKDFAEIFDCVGKGELNFKKVVHDRILGFFEAADSARYRIKNNPDYKDLAIHPFVLTRFPVYHGVTKNGVDDKTYKKLCDAFRELEQNRAFQPILDRYE